MESDSGLDSDDLEYDDLTAVDEDSLDSNVSGIEDIWESKKRYR
mgnify:CR=1 FL=1